MEREKKKFSDTSNENEDQQIFLQRGNFENDALFGELIFNFKFKFYQNKQSQCRKLHEL